MNDFPFLMIGAMYENGGNTTHRFLDGHPQLFVYPFESQLGTRYVNDMLASVFPVKYRWPVFPLDGSPLSDYKAIIDEECKVRSRTPLVSKFRTYPFDLNDDERCEVYTQYVSRHGRSAGGNIRAFFQATFDCWKDFRRSGRESVYVGYSPVITIDADKIFNALPGAHFLHVVRNPWSAFADTSKRPVPMSLENYLLGWILNQHHALLFKDRFPNRFHIVRIEDVMRDSKLVLGDVCQKLGLETSDSLSHISWNGTQLEQVAPWGTIRVPTPEVNRQTALELNGPVIDEIRQRARLYLDAFDYTGFFG